MGKVGYRSAVQYVSSVPCHWGVSHCNLFVKFELNDKQ